MNHDQVLAVVGATVGLAVALVTMGLARAPGCRELRWLGLIAATAGAICALRPLAQSLDGDLVARVLTRLGIGLGGVVSYGWLRYEAAETGRPTTRLDRALGASVLAFAAVALIPSAVLGQDVVRHGDGWSDARYVDVTPTTLGIVSLVVMFATPAVVLARYVRRARRGEPRAAAHVAALGGLLFFGAADAIEGTWIHGWTHLMPVGLLWTIATVGVVLVARFVEGVRALADASGRLRTTVVERTEELACTRATLAESELPATLGRLSAAVAHEINNPAAVVAANLGYLRETMGADGRSEEELAAIGDTLESIDRIVRIVRQLGDAGEFALHGGTTEPVAVADVVRAVVAGVHTGPDASVSVDVSPSLHAATQEASFKQVLASLVASALEAGRAAGSGGTVVVRADRRGERVLVRVEDPTPEANEVMRARRFGPFIDPRPATVRGDVGLTVSVALLRMFGGTIQLERADERGSVVRIELRTAETPSQRSEAPVSSTGQRARVLVVDDDVLTRIGFRRLVGREYIVDEAGGVEAALTHVREHGDDIDVIVCDVVMPEGGAERLLEELGRVAPYLVQATVLLTGGAVDAATEALIRTHADRVLRKPVDIATLRATIERVRLRRRPSLSSRGS